jgi:hypothetical protein
LSDREASHIGFFDLVFAGRTDAAIAALYTHLAMWPRDALIVSVAANPNGLLGGPGRIGQKRKIAVPMDGLAPHYESGEPETVRDYLSSWFTTYPRDGFFYGHLSWHLSLCEIQAGDWAGASRLYWDAITLDRRSGGAQQTMSDGAAFLWRSELAGHPRDTAAWRRL